MPSMTICPAALSMIRNNARVNELFPAPVRPTIPTYNHSKNSQKFLKKYFKYYKWYKLVPAQSGDALKLGREPWAWQNLLLGF